MGAGRYDVIVVGARAAGTAERLFSGPRQRDPARRASARTPTVSGRLPPTGAPGSDLRAYLRF